MPKRNRDKLLEMSMYDFLCMLNANLRTNTEPIPCIMNALGINPNRGNRCRGFKAECDKCIQDFLNSFPF